MLQMCKCAICKYMNDAVHTAAVRIHISAVKVKYICSLRASLIQTTEQDSFWTHRSWQTLFKPFKKENGFVLISQKVFHDKTKKITKHYFFTTCFPTCTERNAGPLRLTVTSHLNHSSQMCWLTECHFSTQQHSSQEGREAHIPLAFSNSPVPLRLVNTSMPFRRRRKRNHLELLEQHDEL